MQAPAPDTWRTGGSASVEIMMFGAVVIWAANYPVAKYGLGGIAPPVFNCIRYLIASGALALLFVRRVEWKTVAPADRPGLFIVGVIGNVLYQMAFIGALSLTTAANTSVLVSTSPLWTMLIEAHIQRRRVPRVMATGMVISIVGIVFIIVGSGAQLEVGGANMYGDLLCLAAAMMSGLSTNLQRTYLLRYPPIQMTLVFTAVGAVGLTLIAVPAAASMDWASVQPSYYGAAFASGFMSIAVAGVFWSYGIGRLGAGRAANYNNLVPVLAFLASYLALREEATALQVAGAVITIGGVWYARRA